MTGRLLESSWCCWHGFRFHSAKPRLFFQNAIDHPEVEKLLADNAKFDVVINSVFVANEMGYYLAHR